MERHYHNAKQMDKHPNIFLTDCNVICAGGGKDDLLQGLHRAPHKVMQLSHTLLRERPGYFGAVNLPKIYQSKDLSRTCGILRYLADQMAATIERLKSRYRPDRVAVLIGTTTTGVREVESQPSVSQVNYHGHQELAAVSEDLANYCGFSGPNMAVSTACTSGAKALGLARRLIDAGWCDAALTGGSESLNRLTCQGFESLESYSMGYCKPFQADRDGINIGEGAALFAMEKGSRGIALSGFSESSDAWHEAAPDPKGSMATVAINSALADASIDSDELDYINLHGTGTRLNDAMEAGVIHRIFGAKIPASSTKSITGHTLGAAGAVEAAILWLLLDRSSPVQLPPHHGAKNYDQTLPRINLVKADDNPPRTINAALSTSFAFGGHNTALVLTRFNG